MKKPYIEPEIELITIRLTNDLLFQSDFESGGENPDWDWNDGENPVP